jgi:hypothetical protein
MKRKSIIIVVSMILILIASCDEPQTVVTNYVYPDGSVLRKIEIRNPKNNFKMTSLQVPFDSTWTVKDSLEISQKGDTTWIKRAEKHFKNIDQINLAYMTDSSANKSYSRNAGFRKRFKWFNSEYRFSERIEKISAFGDPVKEFLNNEELLYFYSPESLKQEKENGPDSLKYKALSDSVKNKTDKWTLKNFILEWTGEFSKLTNGKAGQDISRESLKAREAELEQIIAENDKKFDSLWANGVILKKFIGETNALRYKAEADSAMKLAESVIINDFKDYSLRIAMPGKLIGTNGFIDSSQVLQWPVKSDYFMTEPYIMWAESKLPNIWAWLVSGLFLAFVVTGVIVRIIKKD